MCTHDSAGSAFTLMMPALIELRRLEYFDLHEDATAFTRLETSPSSDCYHTDSVIAPLDAERIDRTFRFDCGNT